MSRPSSIPKMIRMLMLDRELRISDLARLCDTSERYVYFILQGERRAPKHRTTIADSLGISEERFSIILSNFKKPQDRPKEI